MSQQGEKPTGHEDDWWGQLYDDSTGDTGPAPAADTLDDRFASASGTVGRGSAGDAPLEAPPLVPEQRGAGPYPDPAPPGSGAAPAGSSVEGAATGSADRRPGDPPRGPAPWEPPSVRPSGPVTFPPAPTPPGFRADAPTTELRSARPPADLPRLPDRPPADVAPSTNRPPAGPPAPAPGDAPPPPPVPPYETTPQGPVSHVPAPPGEAPAATEAGAAVPVAGTSQAVRVADAADVASPRLSVPRGPAPVDHVGSGPPTYHAEPTALPLADPEDLDDLVPDTVLDGARYGACTLRAVSARGDSGRYRGEPRRDALLTARFGTGDQALLLVAMATGARATPGAHRAAAEACHWIGRSVGRSHVRLGEDIRAARRGDLKSGLQRLTDRSLGKLRASAAGQGVEPEEYTATLRCLLLPADPACRTRVFFGVGGGGLFRLRDGEWQDIEPRAAETAGEAVVGFGALPSETPEGDRLTMDLGITTPPSPYEPAPEPPRDPFRFRASIARPGDTLLLCSSGLADPLRDEPQLAEHLTARWSEAEPPGLAAFLADTLVRVKGYADDRTAAAVWEA
ncbi:hypothetical protein AAW14_11135 [Streptomyces hygroscopicus]|uniref:protein phosphatase 2C domain-containing protein n=1 Tax=Streptomyces hygroscopicus TaxID=1912 RepID=UPI00223E92A1|nr:protein phosphatase 2C domain-containing protein [Streptomyces hygroscopicus]MCW7942581.1 hypothetical protein [Streptomyces hygroscopicus]